LDYSRSRLARDLSFAEATTTSAAAHQLLKEWSTLLDHHRAKAQTANGFNNRKQNWEPT
jgi:hypothetical protein